MTRQGQRLLTNLSVFITGLLLAAIIGWLSFSEITIPQILTAALGSIITLYGVIVRDNRNRSEIDRDELDAEISREQRVKSAEREMRGNLMSEDSVKRLIAEQIGDAK